MQPKRKREIKLLEGMGWGKGTIHIYFEACYICGGFIRVCASRLDQSRTFIRESYTLNISKRTKDLTNQKFCSSFFRGLYEEGSGTHWMEKIDDHCLRRSTNHVRATRRQSTTTPNKKRDWLASRLCVTSKRTQAQHTKPKQTQKTILLNSTISSPIATGPLLLQTAKHTYLQGTEDFKICLDLSLRWSSGVRTYMWGRKQGSFGAESEHPFTHSQFTACDGLGNQLEVVSYLKQLMHRSREGVSSNLWHRANYQT
jgi:hypothetical protein